MTETRYTFKKSERLCSKKIIDQVFGDKNARKISNFPLIIIYKQIPLQGNSPVQILISVGKKYSKKAVERNKVKRQLRELYRINKHNLYLKLINNNMQLALLLLFVGREKFSFQELKVKFEELFEHLIKAV